MNDSNYEPVTYFYKEEHLTLSQLSMLPECQVEISALYQRLLRGWTPENAVTLPLAEQSKLPRNPQNWKTMVEFNETLSLTYKGWCWIVHEGRVTEAYYAHERFYIDPMSIGTYNGVISHVWPWWKPKLPTT